MRSLTVICGGLAALSLMGVASGQDKDAIKDELKSFDGTWELKWFEQGGAKSAVKDFKEPIEIFGFNTLTTIKDGQMTMRVNGKTLKYLLAVKPSKKLKELDRVVADGETKGQVYRYLYELDGDTLRLCYNAEMADVRPPIFKSVNALTILTFVRKKPEA
jgi:uncharacterized protein (TIGR03067 family)